MSVQPAVSKYTMFVSENGNTQAGNINSIYRDCFTTLKEIISQSDQYLVSKSSKTYVFLSELLS